jgi:hypothetical protein
MCKIDMAAHQKLNFIPAVQNVIKESGLQVACNWPDYDILDASLERYHR